MRLASIALAACLVSLGGCGSPENRQADNASANTAAATNLQARISAGDVPKVMNARHEGMETIGKNNKVLFRELSGGSPNLDTVRASAKAIAQLSMESSAWFPEGTGPEMGKTGAKPDIWLPQNKADFAAKLHNFQIAAPAFQAAANGTDVSLMKARFATLGGACKACHDKYRTEMHHDH